jgi:hypothetical protein
MEEVQLKSSPKQPEELTCSI